VHTHSAGGAREGNPGHTTGNAKSHDQHRTTDPVKQPGGVLAGRSEG